jgi:kynurenine formamidase
MGTADNWGRWGTDDERGALNLLTPDVVKEALKAPKTGKVYSLSIPIQRSGIPNFEFRGAPQRLTLAGQGDEAFHRSVGGVEGVGANEDMLVMAAHTATHLDALGHVYEGRKLYNGFSAEEVSAMSGAPRCGVDKIGAIVGRGVLVDVAAALGVSALDPGHVITVAEFELACSRESVELRSGDIVLIRTGWLEGYMNPDDGFDIHPQPGIGLELAEHLAASDVCVVGADNSAVEALPFDQGVYLGSHIVLLVSHGIHLLEHVALQELSRDGCYEFLVTIAPLNVPGATGSPVTPVAVG